MARFTLPEGTDPSTPLVLDAGAVVVQAEVWDGRAWAPLALEAAADGDPSAGGGVPAPDVSAGVDVVPTVPAPDPSAGVAVAPAPPRAVVIGAAGGDPFGPPKVARLPAGAVQNGAVYVRVALTPDMSANMLLQVRGAA